MILYNPRRGMGPKMNRWIAASGLLLVLMLAVHASMASNSTWDRAREKKARIVKKLKKDFRKLKKQDGEIGRAHV